MKKTISLLVLLCFTAMISWSQKSDNSSIPLIGTKAPSFKAESTNGEINFPDDFGKNWKIIFSHPQDFTPVCSSELLELSYLQPEFDKLGVKIIVVSTDQLSQHIAWKASMESLQYKDRMPQKINFPMVSDEHYIISEKYGMFHYPTSTPKDIRGVYIIDPDDIVQCIFFYPNSIGRNMDEFLRTVKALQSVHDNVVIPANWEPGDDVMISYYNQQDKDAKGSTSLPLVYEVSFFMIFKKLPKDQDVSNN
jgi:peroxiredoxin (alkyl hydroperoxide reductase subunit C)